MKRLLTAFLTLILLLPSISGCSLAPKTAEKPAPPPPTVEVVTMAGELVDVYRDVPAQTYARDKVDVRGRVDGYIEERLFQPGQQVKAGQPLYKLDLRPFRAQLAASKGKLREAQADVTFAEQQVSLSEAQANLASANASLLKAKQDYVRYKELVEEGAVSKQDFDTATANLTTAQAQVKARTAAVQQAKVTTNTQIDSARAKAETQAAEVESAALNVRYSTITAPIGGIVGDSQIPVGGLVSASSTTALTTIVPLDPLWVRFKVTESQYLNYKRNHKGDSPVLEMFLADGSKFPYPGKVANTLNEVDRRTGTLEVQAKFPNPEKTVLPGQFARVKYVREHLANTITVPLKAVQQTQSQTSVFVVGANNIVESRVVKLGQRVGEKFIVESGLQIGERVVTEGQLAVRAGIKVNPVNSNESRTASNPREVH